MAGNGGIHQHVLDREIINSSENSPPPFHTWAIIIACYYNEHNKITGENNIRPQIG